MRYEPDRLDYEEAKQVLEILATNTNVIGDNYSPITWFGIAKFFKELLSLITSPSEELILNYASIAIKAFLNAGLPYAALRVLESILSKIQDHSTARLVDLFKSESFNRAKLFSLLARAKKEPALIHLYIREILSSCDDRLEASLELRNAIRTFSSNLNFDSWMSILFNDVKNYSYDIFCKVLGIYLASINKLDALDSLPEQKISCRLTALYEALSEIKNLTEKSRIFIRSFLDRIPLDKLTSKELQILSRILMILLRRNFDANTNFIETVIQSVYNHGLIDETIGLAMHYSLFLLQRDINKSLVYLDLAIMLSYQLNEKSTVIKIFSEYLAKVLSLRLVDWAYRIVDIMYSENKIVGIQNYLLFEKAIDIIDKKSAELLLGLLEKILEQYPYTRPFLQPLKLLVKLKFSANLDLMQKILSAHPIFVLKAAKILSVDSNIIKFLELISKSTIKPAEKTAIYFATAIRAKSNKKLLDEIIDIIIGDFSLKNTPKYPTFLLDLAQQIKNYLPKKALTLASIAHKEFEKRGLYWMSINALALYLALKRIIDSGSISKQNES